MGRRRIAYQVEDAGLLDRVRLFAGSHDAARNGCNRVSSTGRALRRGEPGPCQQTAAASEQVSLIFFWSSFEIYEERYCDRAGLATRFEPESCVGVASQVAMSVADYP
jgi:hypothetical protein